MAHVTHGAGCFRADYPEQKWKSIACTTAPNHPFVPPTYLAALPGSAAISSTTGSFGPSTVTGESSGGGVGDLYSLQLNTSPITEGVCEGYSNCHGWQQFIFSNPGDTGQASVFMQYWLIAYPYLPSCPPGWNYSPPGQGDGCWMNSASAPVPLQTASSIPLLTLTGTAASGGQDEAQLSTGTSIYVATGSDNVLGLANDWVKSEFNVYGDSPEAAFNAGTLLSVEMMINSGPAGSPVPTEGYYSGESNNLTLAALGPCMVADPTGNYLWFQEDYDATPSTSCALPAPTVTTQESNNGTTEVFTLNWPTVNGATYYLRTVNGNGLHVTGNTTIVNVRCQGSAVVQMSSCDAAGCLGRTETILNVTNNNQCR